jgi:hypothetical protein
MPNWQVPAKSLGMYKKKSYFQVAVFAKAGRF